MLDAPLSSNMAVYAKWEIIEELQGTQAEFSGFIQVSDTEYSMTVSNNTEYVVFNDIIAINSKSTWALSSDRAGTQTIENGTVELIPGDNVFYVLVTAENSESKLYTIRIRRRLIYIVSFNANGGSEVQSQKVEEGFLATAPTTTKAGYTFVSWNYDFSKPIERNEILTASWVANTYTLTYDTNGGTIDSATAEVVFDSAYVLKQPTKSGYIFKGWYNGNTLFEDGIWSYTSNITLTAKWEADLSGVTFENAEYVYDGIEKNLCVSGILPDGVSVEYKNNKLTNVGDVIATATFTCTEGSLPFTTLTAKLTIKKAEAALDYSNAETTFVYDGTEHSISGIVGTGAIAYKNNAFTNAGSYIVNVFCEETANYNSGNFEVEAVVEKAEISGISFNDAEYLYDLEDKYIYISGILPEGVTVSYENNGKYAVGEYTVTAIFTVNNPNYKEKAAMTAKLIISPRTCHVYFVYGEDSILDREVNYGEDLTNIPQPTPINGYVVSWNITDFTNIKQDIYV